MGVGGLKEKVEDTFTEDEMMQVILIKRSRRERFMKKIGEEVFMENMGEG